MRRVLVLTAALLLLGGATTASAATRAWRVTAVLTGTYANDVTASGARCAAQYREQITGLRMTLRSPAIRYDSAAPVFAGPLRFKLRGRWRVTGQYTAANDPDNAPPGCAPRPTPIDCAAGIVADDGQRLRNTGTARLSVAANARGAVGTQIVAPRLTEQVADGGIAPAGWPSACHVQTDDQTVPVTPFFGLSSTGLADRALARRILIPRRKLTRRRGFTVSAAPVTPSGCAGLDGFAPCAEQGALRLRVTFRPA